MTAAHYSALSQQQSRRINDLYQNSCCRIVRLLGRSRFWAALFGFELAYVMALRSLGKRQWRRAVTDLLLYRCRHARSYSRVLEPRRILYSAKWLYLLARREDLKALAGVLCAVEKSGTGCRRRAPRRKKSAKKNRPICARDRHLAMGPIVAYDPKINGKRRLRSTASFFANDGCLLIQSDAGVHSSATTHMRAATQSFACVSNQKGND